MHVSGAAINKAKSRQVFGGFFFFFCDDVSFYNLLIIKKLEKDV
jgi:hypothetical protein